MKELAEQLLNLTDDQITDLNSNFSDDHRLLRSQPNGHSAAYYKCVMDNQGKACACDEQGTCNPVTAT